MGFRMRKSFKVMPGVRMTVTPRGVSASVGNKYGRVSAHTSGRVTSSASIPGTGISYVFTSGGGRQSPPERPVAAHAPSFTAPKPSTPGILAPRWEKALFKALLANDVTALESIARMDPAARHTCMALDGFMNDGADKDFRSRSIFEELWGAGYDPAHDRFMNTYVASAITTIGVAPGIAFSLPLSRDAIGLLLAELRQEAGDLAGAAEIVESLEPSAPSAVSLAELYGQEGRWRDVVELTNGVDGKDDVSIFLLTQRGIALGELGHYEAAREVFKTSLSRRSQPQELRHRTLLERAVTNRAEGKKAMARKDLERIMAEDASYPGLGILLDELKI